MLAYPDLKGLFVALNAPRLSEHWHIVLVSAAAAFAIQKLSIPISALALGPRFRALSGDKKHKWGIQLVSMLHALEASIMSLWVFEDESLRQDPVYGFSYTAERIYAVSMGYFIWDTIICLSNISMYGPSFALHGVTALIAMLIPFHPLMQRYGTIFMLFEITTIFLNAHWFMDKLGISGTLIQIINDITLVLSYLGIRIMFGTYAIYNCLGIMYQARSALPTGAFPLLVVLAVIVSSLNYYWFYKLVRATIRQFTSRSDGVRLKKTR